MNFIFIFFRKWLYINWKPITNYLSAIEQVHYSWSSLGGQKGVSVPKFIYALDGNGLPITFLVSVGQRHEAVLFEPLMEQGAVKRSGPGRPRIRPRRVSGDKGFSSDKIRFYLRRRGIRYTIPRKVNEHRGGKFDKALYRMRNGRWAMFQPFKAISRPLPLGTRKKPKTTWPCWL